MLINTLVWVVLVPLVATSFGLLYAVLVDKARFEAVAKSLIFMPMAISFVGASIIWKFVYAYRGDGRTRSACSTRSWSGSAASRSSGCSSRR